MLVAATATASCVSAVPQPADPARSVPMTLAELAPEFTINRTDVTTAGNRVATGRGALTTTQPVDIELPARPVWVIADLNGRWFVTFDDGTATWVDLDGAVEPAPDSITDPPELTASGIRSAYRGQPLFDDPLADTRVVATDAIVAALVEPTKRYGHGVLGDAVEASRVAVVDRASGAEVRFGPAEPGVIEGISPILADIDGDGVDDVLVTQSSNRAGAWLAAYRADGTLLGESEPIGTANRWRNQMGVAAVGPHGETEIVDVRTPHLGGTVEYFQLIDGALVRVAASEPIFTSHQIGSRNLDLAVIADAVGDGQLDVVVPTSNRSSLVVLTRTDDGVSEVGRLELNAPMTTNLATSTTGERLSFAVGLSDNRLRIWPGQGDP